MEKCDSSLKKQHFITEVLQLLLVSTLFEKLGIGQQQALIKYRSNIKGSLQVFISGETVSEGGFEAGSVASAALLGTATDKDRKGKPYYQLEILSRSADGDEGGRHQLFKATVSNGNLYILKVQAGDKRWFKGTDKDW
eukprot:92808-Pelagomonas_calceolata.AAC.1